MSYLVTRVDPLDEKVCSLLSLPTTLLRVFFLQTSTRNTRTPCTYEKQYKMGN